MVPGNRTEVFHVTANNSWTIPIAATKMRYSIVAPALLAGTAFAWLPQERDLAAFNQTARHEQLGKRFEPALPSGVTKIRGVNFGGRFKT